MALEFPAFSGPEGNDFVIISVEKKSKTQMFESFQYVPVGVELPMSLHREGVREKKAREMKRLKFEEGL